MMWVGMEQVGMHTYCIKFSTSEPYTNTPFPLAYLLTCCAFQLFFGKLYTFFSIKYVYLAAIFMFEVGSGKRYTSILTPLEQNVY